MINETYYEMINDIYKKIDLISFVKMWRHATKVFIKMYFVFIWSKTLTCRIKKRPVPDEINSKFCLFLKIFVET